MNQTMSNPIPQRSHPRPIVVLEACLFSNPDYPPFTQPTDIFHIGLQRYLGYYPSLNSHFRLPCLEACVTMVCHLFLIPKPCHLMELRLYLPYMGFPVLFTFLDGRPYPDCVNGAFSHLLTIPK